jgi:6-phosphogluconolactonase (cycloisomerase 2 family)
MRLLVGTYGSAIYELEVDLAKGEFRESYSTPALNASYLDVGKHFAYAVSESGPQSGAYSFEREEGKWHRTAFVVNDKADSCHILNAGRYVLTADFGRGTISVFSKHLEALDKVVYVKEVGGHPHQIIPLAGGTFAAANRDGNCVHIFRLGDDGEIFQIVDLQTGDKTGPRFMTFDQKRNILYLLTEWSGEVISWRTSDLDTIHPSFVLYQRVQADEAHGDSADIHITRDGRFLLTSHRNDNDGICVFGISADGRLSKLYYRHTGLHPRCFVITPDGEHVIAACRDSQSIELYDFNMETGFLSSKRASYMLSQDDKPVFLYAD